MKLQILILQVWKGSKILYHKQAPSEVRTGPYRTGSVGKESWKEAVWRVQEQVISNNTFDTIIRISNNTFDTMTNCVTYYVLFIINKIKNLITRSNSTC